MRHFLAIATVLSLAAGAAHAQIYPAQKPYNPYALPTDPSMAPAKPHPQLQQHLLEPPKVKGYEPFKPVKPVKTYDVDNGASGLYPELHQKPKKPAANPF